MRTTTRQRTTTPRPRRVLRARKRNPDSASPISPSRSSSLKCGGCPQSSHAQKVRAVRSAGGAAARVAWAPSRSTGATNRRWRFPPSQQQQRRRRQRRVKMSQGIVRRCVSSCHLTTSYSPETGCRPTRFAVFASGNF